MAPHEDSIEIAASPVEVFDLVSNLTRMGEWSPENDGGEWVGGASGPAAGVRFKGQNSHGEHTWTTTARIVTCEPPSSFIFDVTYGPFKIARWSYSIAKTDGGCRVSESWVDRRNALIKRLGATVEDRDGFTKESIAKTLAALKATAEG